jgi:nitroreductase
LPLAFARAFDEHRLARAVAVDDGDEGVLAVAALAGELAGRRGLATGPARSCGCGSDAAWRDGRESTARRPFAGWHWPAQQTPATPSLPDPWPRPPHARTTHPPGQTRRRRLRRHAVVGASASDADPRAVLARIATRRSLRRFAPGPLDRATLAAILGAALAVAPVFSRAVRLRLVAHRVEGLAPGAWQWRDGDWTRTGGRAADGDWPVASRAAALDQDVIGEPPAVVVLSIDRATFASDPLGPARGWRHAFLEAGLLGERLYLEAAARGAGACAVGAFHDDEAAALVGVDPAHEWVVHFCALGRPA